MTTDDVAVLRTAKLAGMDVKPVRHRDSGVLAMAVGLYDLDGNQVGRLIMDKDAAHQFLANATMVLTIMDADPQSKTPRGVPGAALN